MTNIQTQFIIKPLVGTGKIMLAGIDQGYVVLPVEDLVTLGVKIRSQKEGESNVTAGAFVYLPKSELKQLILDLQDYVTKKNRKRKIKLRS